MNICVYCSSSDAVAPVYFRAAEELGEIMARREDTLVYGGAGVGLMGALARSVNANGGRVIGIMPESIAAHDIGFESADEMIIAASLRERKRMMEEKADVFIALPGGFGTLEELFEILTLKQLGRHEKPIAILNINGFYDPLVNLFNHIYNERFAKSETAGIYSVCATVSESMEYIDTYSAPRLTRKWYR